MKGMAIVRTSVTEGHEDQIKKTGAYAISEGINMAHLCILAEDKDLETVIPKLNQVDVVIVTDITRISQNDETLERFKKHLVSNNVQLRTLS